MSFYFRVYKIFALLPHQCGGADSTKFHSGVCEWTDPSLLAGRERLGRVADGRLRLRRDGGGQDGHGEGGEGGGGGQLHALLRRGPIFKLDGEIENVCPWSPCLNRCDIVQIR